jgi:hypothetical protein
MTKRTRKNIPKGFDSWLEYDLSKVLRQCKFHTEKIPYIQRKTYEPDFIFYDEARGATHLHRSEGEVQR